MCEHNDPIEFFFHRAVKQKSQPHIEKETNIYNLKKKKSVIDIHKHELRAMTNV